MDDLTRARRRQQLKEAIKHGRITIAPQTKTDAYRRETAHILIAIAEITNQSSTRHALVTDLSIISDFFSFGKPSRANLSKLSQRLGLTIQAEDLLWQVAHRLSTKK